MKTKGKILIILIVVIVILGGVLAYLYFGTDLLKTNKQLFFKYLGQTIEIENGFIDNQLTEYNSKKMTGKYEDNGKFSVDIDVADMDEDMLAIVNNFNVTYTGKIDNTARKNEQEISINYSDEVNFPLKYKYANETLGLQTDCISDKYLGIENKNLKEFVEKFGVTDTDNIPEIIDFFADTDTNQQLTFTDEEKEQLKNTYQPILMERIGEKEFIKTEENGITNYSVEMTNQELIDTISALLEALKNDQVLLPKMEVMFQKYLDMMNQSSTEEVTMQSIIQQQLDRFNSSKVEEGTSKITVSQTNRRLTGIALAIDEAEIKLTKTDNQDTLTYRVELKEQDPETQGTLEMYFNASYQGLEQLTSVNENYEVGINILQNGEEQKLKYNFNCIDTFNDSINIEDYGENEVEIINDYDNEQIVTLLVAIIQRIGEVNNTQMEEIGFSEYGNPMLYIFPINSLGLVDDNQTLDVIDEDATDGESNDGINETSSMSDLELQSFNQKFAQYEGSQRGTTIMSLLQTVLSNNVSATDDSRKVEVTGDITMSKDATTAPRDSVDTSSTYNVQLEYTEGLVSQIIITQE